MMHKRQAAKTYRDGCRVFANKQTNTPSNFVLCSLCEEKFAPKLTPDGFLGDQERNVREYNSALDYINSCHSIINHMMTQNKEFRDYFVSMPSVPNFLDLFSVLLSNGFESRKKRAYEPHVKRSESLRKTKAAEEDQQRQTSDSETSDFEMDVLQNAGKVPMPKFKSKLPRTGETIYEEDVPENVPASPKRVILKSPKAVQKKSPPPSPQRVKRYSDIIAAPVQDMSRKLKPRSYSATASRTKANVIEKKSGHDLSANYSDTAIGTPGNANHSSLSQQDLDKYAKELLGSGSASPIHSPRSSSPDNRSGPTIDKSPSRTTRKSPKPTTPPTQGGRRYSELLKRTYSSNQTIPSTESSCAIKQPSLQKVTHTMEQSASMPTNPSATAQNKRQKPSEPPRPGTPTVKMASQGGTNYSVFTTLQQAVKEKNFSGDDNPYAMQEYMQNQMKKYEGSRVKIGEQPADAEGYKLRTTPSKCASKTKQRDCFGSAKKLSTADMKIIESQVQLFVEQHIESDDIKTDSDIEEDRTLNKQSADERPIRSTEDRQKNFRRKHSESEEEEQIGKFTEEHAYSTTTDGYQRIHQPGSPPPTKRSQISDESSDIKSDEEAYDQRRPIHVHRRGAGYAYAHTGPRR